MTVHNVANREEFYKTINSNGVVVVDAFATWCGPCKAISPQIAKWSNAEEYKDVHFAKFDVDAVPDLAQELGISAMPTFLVFKDGEKADEFIGANPPALKRMFDKYAA